ncbi:MAG: class I SAM-dependent DNA methyltransferase [Waterburya sp.]
MNSTTTYSDYNSFSRIMNESWGPEDSENLLPNIEALFLKYLPQQSCILDLCCGTGNLAQKLQNKGYQVTGLDSSSELLRYARENASQSKFILDDARYFKLPEASFEGIISTNYGLNHITKLEELAFAFQNAYTALKSDGLLMFDLRLDKLYKGESWHNDMSGDVQDEYAWALKRSYNSEEKIGNIYITIFELTDNNWQRSDVTWSVKGYSLEEVLATLENIGFKDINYYNQKDISANKKEADVVYFVCRK